MKIDIENYRGFIITFDTREEKFNCVVSTNNSKESKSFAAVKKFIDDYKKDSQNFEPFKIEKRPDISLGYHTVRNKPLTVIGLRKDERFVIEDFDGGKGQISSYDENSYMVVNDKNNKILSDIIALDSEFNKIKEEYKNKKAELMIQLNIVTLKDMKEKLL